MADAFGGELDFHLHVRSFADDLEDCAYAPDFVADFVAFGKGVRDGVFLGQARGHGLGENGDALAARDSRCAAALGHGAFSVVVFHELRRDFP